MLRRVLWGVLWGVLVLMGCAGEPVVNEPSTRVEPPDVQAVLAALPRCEAGAEVGVLTVKAARCTRMFCKEACCNRCSWAATFEAKSGQVVPAELARVREVLRLDESALDCELKAWGDALAGQSVALGPPACQVR